MRTQRASLANPPKRHPWRRRALGQSGTFLLLCGAAAGVAAEATDKGRTGLLWLDDTPVPKVCRAIGVLLATIGTIRTAIVIAKLGIKAARADVAADLEAILAREMRREIREISEQMALYSSGRVSLFVRGPDCYFLVARFSSMERFNRCSGRSRYELGEGALGEAGDRGKFERLGLANPGNADEPAHEWVEQQIAMKVRAEDARSLTMRSRSYAGLRLQFESGVVGVVVAESERARGATLKALEECTAAQARLSRLLAHAQTLDQESLAAAFNRCLKEGAQ